MIYWTTSPVWTFVSSTFAAAAGKMFTVIDPLLIPGPVVLFTIKVVLKTAGSVIVYEAVTVWPSASVTETV